MVRRRGGALIANREGDRRQSRPCVAPAFVAGDDQVETAVEDAISDSIGMIVSRQCAASSFFSWRLSGSESLKLIGPSGGSALTRRGEKIARCWSSIETPSQTFGGGLSTPTSGVVARA
jgi:hypothetical protein